MPELTAAHLRAGLRMGRWSGTLPGAARLAGELDVAPATIRAALRLLEAEGLLTGRGPGRSRGISAGAAGTVAAPLRVAVLRYDARVADNPQTSAVLIEIMHTLEAAGHEAFFCKKSQIELKHEVNRLTRQLAGTRADAWVVEAGSRPLLEWCAAQPTPCLALYGRAANLPLASTGPNTVPAYRAAVRHLLALGHRRMVFIASDARRKPTPGLSASAFLEELTAHGVTTSEYNLPDWEETPEGFNTLLKSLFRHTPPTALFIDEAPYLVAAMAFLARHRINVPEQVSLVLSGCDASLDSCYPPFTQMRWDHAPIVRRVVRWVGAVRQGNPDRRQISYPTEFVPGGGSIGPVWKG